MPVIELEGFNHFHYMQDITATQAICGKRGRIARILPDTTWMGAPGPFPATWCKRCSANQDQTRKCQLDYFRWDVLARVAGVEIKKFYTRRYNLEELFATRSIAGVGYIDVQGAIQEAKRLRLNQDTGECCIDWGPDSGHPRFDSRSLVYA